MTTAGGGMFCVDNAGHDRHFGIVGSEVRTRTWPHGTTTVGGANANDGAWHNIVYTFGGGAGEYIYMNGNQISYEAGKTHSNYNWDQEAYVGWSTDYGYFTGMLDEVNVYNMALSSGDVSALNSQKSGGSTMVEKTLFSVTIDQLMDSDWLGAGGFGKFATTSGYTMTAFQPACGLLGVDLKLEFTGGNDIEFTADEDCFGVDGEGSLRIKTSMSNPNGYFYIAVGNSNKPGWRGLCFHNEQWGQGWNCDGDAGQSCGMGLWGQYASNEITGCPSNINGYWNDMGPNDCVNADVCVGSSQETLTLVATKVVKPAMTLYSMNLDTLMNADFLSPGGFGKFSTTSGYTMTNFQQSCGYKGRSFRLEFSGGNDITFTADEDCFGVDGEGSLRIKTTMGSPNGYFYIAVGNSNKPGWRGMCFHNEQWG